MMAFIFWTRVTKDNMTEMTIAFLSMILFLTFGFLRLYNYFQFEKTKNLTDKEDFVNFFDSLSFERLIQHVVTPFPILQRQTNDQERKIKRRINISTVLVWVFFGLMIFFFPNLN